MHRFHWEKVGRVWLALFSMTLFAGCASNAGSLPTASRSSSGAKIEPTLIEPFVDSRNRKHWYQDKYTDSPQGWGVDSSLPFDDLQQLRRTQPQVVNVLELANMPNLKNVGLLAHLVSLLDPHDSQAEPLLLDLEARGHRLAAAARLDQAARQWIKYNIQARHTKLAELASRAAHGDAQALQEFSRLHDHVIQSTLSEPVEAAIRSLVAAQHYYRSRIGKSLKFNYGFYVLRRISYADAFDLLERMKAAGQLPDDLRGSSSRTGCFAVSGAAWDELEKRTLHYACMDWDRYEEASIRYCTHHSERMNAIVNSLAYAEIVAAKTAEVNMLSGYKVAGRLQVQNTQVLAFTDEDQDDEGLDREYRCDVLLDWTGGDPQMHSDLFYQRMLWKNTMAAFRASMTDEDNPKLVYLMGVVVKPR